MKSPGMAARRKHLVAITEGNLTTLTTVREQLNSSRKISALSDRLPWLRSNDLLCGWHNAKSDPHGVHSPRVSHAKS